MILGPYLNIVEKLNVLLLGDDIADVYEYVKVLGKASKENVMAAETIREQYFDGGTKAAYKHLANFCGKVTMYTGPSRTTKRRFVDEVYLRKLFEVHTMEAWPDRQIGVTGVENYDMVVVTDFGHGAITTNLIGGVVSHAKYLAINVQTNAANYGYNLVTKWPYADFMVIDEPEARLAMRDRTSSIENVMRLLASHGFKKFIVTHGRHGSYGYDGDIWHVPAITDKVVDTMGAGDAFFCATAPFAYAGMDMANLLKVGNAAGAAKVGIIGNSRAITLNDIVRGCNL